MQKLVFYGQKTRVFYVKNTCRAHETITNQFLVKNYP